MKTKNFILNLFSGLLFTCYSMTTLALPPKFVYLTQIDSRIIQDVRYYTSNNFVGHPIAGYKKPIIILTKPTALALRRVENQLNRRGLGLKVYDAYRPQMAVDDFIKFSADTADQKTKADYYPNVNKADFFKLGYVASRSSHTRGSTVDLTIIDLNTKKSLDMGTHFDFMDVLSHPLNHAVTDVQFKNRMLLRKLMLKNGFQPLSTEWWHFTLKKEPYPNTYFNFPIE